MSLCSILFWCLLISFDFTVFKKKKSKYSHCTREQKEFSSWGISLGWVYFGGVFCCFIGVFSPKFASIDHSWSPELLLRLKRSPTGQGRIYLATSLHSEQLLPTIPWVGADVRTDFSKKIINTKSFHTIITLGKKPRAVRAQMQKPLFEFGLTVWLQRYCECIINLQQEHLQLFVQSAQGASQIEVRSFAYPGFRGRSSLSTCVC